jgi:hypothetical protein
MDKIEQLEGWLQKLADRDWAGWGGQEAALPPTPACPALPRWRRSILSEKWPAEDQPHLRGCSYCRQIVDVLLQRLWHPSTAELFAHVRRGQDAKEEATVAAHLEKDDCQRCRRRLALLRADGGLARLVEQARGDRRAAERLKDALLSWGVMRLPSFALRNPRAAPLSGHPLELASPRGSDPAATLVEQQGQYLLEVKTKNAAWNRQILRYQVEDVGGRPAVNGFLLLRADAHGWFAAPRLLEARTLYDAVQGKCQDPRVELLDPQELTTRDHPIVVASARADRHDAAARAAWREWAGLVGKGEQVADDLRRLAEEVRGL